MSGVLESIITNADLSTDFDNTIPLVYANIDDTPAATRDRQIKWLSRHIKRCGPISLSTDRLLVGIVQINEDGEDFTIGRYIRPYEYAALCGDYDSFKNLVDKMTLIPSDAYFFIMAMIQQRSHDCIRYLFTKFKDKPAVLARLCQPTEGAWTPYLYAAHCNYPDLVNLFRPYSDLTFFLKDEDYDLTAPMLAIEQGHVETVHYFLSTPECYDEIKIRPAGAPSILTMMIDVGLRASFHDVLTKDLLADNPGMFFNDTTHLNPIEATFNMKDSLLFRLLATLSPSQADEYHYEFIRSKLSELQGTELSHESITELLKDIDDPSLDNSTRELVRAHNSIRLKIEAFKSDPIQYESLRKILAQAFPIAPLIQTAVPTPRTVPSTDTIGAILALNTEMEALRDKIKQLKADMSAKEMCLSEQQAKIDKLSKFKAILEQRTKKSEHNPRIEKANKLIQNLKSELTSTQARLDKIKKMLEGQKIENTNLRRAIEKQKETNLALSGSQSQKKIDCLTVEIRSQAQTISELTAFNTAAETSAASLSEKLKTQNQVAAAYINRSRSLEQRLFIADQQLQDANSLNAQLKHQNKLLASQCHFLHTELLAAKTTCPAQPPLPPAKPTPIDRSTALAFTPTVGTPSGESADNLAKIRAIWADHDLTGRGYSPPKR